MIVMYAEQVPATTDRRVTVTLTFATDDELTAVLQRVVEAIERHGDVGYDVVNVMIHEHTEGERRG